MSSIYAPLHKYNSADPVESTIHAIRATMSHSSHAWLYIGEKIYQAKQRLSNQEFQRVYKELGFTIAQTDKLLKIGEDHDRLSDDQIIPYLYNTGWTNLYELSHLTDSQLASLIETLKSDPHQSMTREFIRGFRTGLAPVTTGATVSLVSISIAESDLSHLTDAQKSRILSAIKTAQDAMSPVVANLNIKVKVHSQHLVIASNDNDDNTSEVAAEISAA